MEDLREEITNEAQQAADEVTAAAEPAPEAGTQSADTAQQAVEAIKESAEAIAEKAMTAAKDAQGTAAKVLDAAKETLEAAAEKAEQFASQAAQAIKEGVSKAAEKSAQAEDSAKEPAAGTPTESMEDYAAELEASFRQINEGDLLTGTVISVTDTDITLDLGYYTDGIIHLTDASDDPSFSLKDRIEVGQTLSATVVRRDDGAGHILLSMKEAVELMAWDRLRALKEGKENVTVKITDTTRSGVIAYLEGVRGFIPASKLALGYVEEDALKSYVGQSIDVRVIDADEEQKHLVMSARDILWERRREEEAAERERKLASVQIGSVTEGKVESLKPYGAFVRLDNGLSGLLHVSQISQKRISQPSEVLKEGQSVKVKIIANKDGKLSLSMKALEDVMEKSDAPAQKEEKYELPKAGNVSTSLGDLFAKLKL